MRMECHSLFGMKLYAQGRLHKHLHLCRHMVNICTSALARRAGQGRCTPVGFSNTKREAFVNVSLVTGSIAKPVWPSGTRVSRTGIRSFSRSFFPDAGQ